MLSALPRILNFLYGCTHLRPSLHTTKTLSQSPHWTGFRDQKGTGRLVLVEGWFCPWWKGVGLCIWTPLWSLQIGTRTWRVGYWRDRGDFGGSKAKRLSGSYILGIFPVNNPIYPIYSHTLHPVSPILLLQASSKPPSPTYI